MNHWERYPSFVVLRLKDASVEERDAIAGYAVECLTNVPYSLQAGIAERVQRNSGKGRVNRERRNSEVKLPENGEQNEWIEELTEEFVEEKFGSKRRELEWDEDEWDDIEGTHCAHLVWYAYNRFGYDVDSDGGVIVTPRDIFESPVWEVVQVYGMPLR